nr:MAG TPA: protein of unknown function (DUF5401) [Caudoviricetes sp.]
MANGRLWITPCLICREPPNVDNCRGELSTTRRRGIAFDHIA